MKITGKNVYANMISARFYPESSQVCAATKFSLKK